MNWDEYYMSIAKTVAAKSKDPSTQVGCVLVDHENRPISFGYNGFIKGCDESFMTFEQPQKNLLSVHAEMNALIFAKRDLTNCKAYVTHASCENCLKHLLQAGITEIIYEKPNTRGKIIDEEKKESIRRLLNSKKNVICRNINGKTFLEEMEEI